MAHWGSPGRNSDEGLVVGLERRSRNQRWGAGARVRAQRSLTLADRSRGPAWPRLEKCLCRLSPTAYPPGSVGAETGASSPDRAIGSSLNNKLRSKTTMTVDVMELPKITWK